MPGIEGMLYPFQRGRDILAIFRMVSEEVSQAIENAQSPDGSSPIAFDVKDE